MKSIKYIILFGSFCFLPLMTYANQFIHVDLDEVAIRKETGIQSPIIGTLSKGDVVAIQSVTDSMWYHLQEGGVIRKNYATVLSDVPFTTNIREGIMKETILTKKQDNTFLLLVKGDRVTIEEEVEEGYKINFYGQVSYISKESIGIDQVNPLVEDIVVYALQFVGNPYQLGGNSLTTGTDCSGFVKLIYEAFNCKLQRSSNLQYSKDGILIAIENLHQGDLIFYGYENNVSHVALYIGNKQVIHAADRKQGICIAPMLLDKPIIGIKRLLK